MPSTTTAKLLGGSPLGLSFYSEETVGGFLERYTISENPVFEDQTGDNIDPFSVSQGTEEGRQQKFERDSGIGYRSFGDYRSRFTHDPKKPNTFYAYYNYNLGNNKRVGSETASIFEYIRSQEAKFYNSDFIDQYSSIFKIVDEMKKISNQPPPESASESKIPSLMLKADDFAYLKHLGVYPTNRLILARRFDTPIGDDLIRNLAVPRAVIPSWLEDGKSFITVGFGEEWEKTKSVDASSDSNSATGKTGDAVSKILDYFRGLANAVATPSFTEWFQYYIFAQTGITDPNNLALLPLGNPNLIRASVRRKTPTAYQDFEGLNYKFEITITTEYEIKYIDGVDPTLAYFDIISNLLRFGTSEAQFQFDTRFNNGAKKIIDDLSSGDSATVTKQLIDLMGKFVGAAGAVAQAAFDLITFGIFGDTSQPVTFAQIASAQIKKNRIRLLAIINSLTGSPSGIYHVTVGNPFRPIFSSGDLIPGEKGHTITLGTELGYNNLPTTIKFSTTLSNARACGLQEIFKKFSPRSIRGPGIISPPISKSDTEKMVQSSRISRIRNPSPAGSSNPARTTNQVFSGGAPLPPGLS